MIYKIVSQEEGKILIEKSEFTHQFEAAEVIKHLTEMERKLKELKAQSDLENATLVNIESFHPFVKELSEQDLNTAKMYWESKLLKRSCDTKVEEIDALIAEYKQAISDIKEQTGLDITA
jgi:DNA-binding transcriptional MerR regulator